MRPPKTAEPTARHTARHTARRGDRGAASVELVVAVPLLLLLLMLVVHTAVWAHAGHGAQAAAARAAEAARAADATADTGHVAGVDMLEAVSAGVLDDYDLTVTRSEVEVTVVVTGVATSVVPGMTWTVHAEAAAPVERFVPESAQSRDGP